MLALKEFAALHTDVVLTLAGFGLGAVFGAIVLATNFCAMGAVSDVAVLGDWRRFRAWVLAAGVALVSTQLLAAAGVVDTGHSMYLAPQLNWLGHIAGGQMFGVGMVLAGGCTSRNLVRVGTGDLRALFVTVVVGITGAMTIGGVLAWPRSALETATAIDLSRFGLAGQGLDGFVALVAGPVPALWVGLLVGATASAWCISNRPFRSSPAHVISGLVIGLTVAAGWAVTGVAYDELALSPKPPASLTYVRPVGDTIDWLERATGLGWPGFGVGGVVGTIAGAAVVAMHKRRLRWQAFTDVGDAARALAGAGLMGVGGVIGLGCTVGQGVTGIATLASGSFLTFAAIVAGGFLGVRLMERLVDA